MLSLIVHAAFEARLSPLAGRIAVLVADLAGTERALGFIAACGRTDEARGIELLEVGTVLQLDAALTRGHCAC